MERRPRSSAAVLGVWLALAAWPGSVHADEGRDPARAGEGTDRAHADEGADTHAETPGELAKGAEPSEEYRARVDAGFDEFARGNFGEARAHFLGALRITPNARLLRALGMVEFELRDYAKALEYLDQALSSGVRPLAQIEREEALHLRERALNYLARFTIDVAPEHAQLRLDGIALVLPPDHSILLNVGDHLLQADAPNFHPARRDLKVGGRRNERITLVLQPLPPSARLSGGARDESGSVFESGWFWVGVGALTASAGIALALVLRARSSANVDQLISTNRTPSGVIIRL